MIQYKNDRLHIPGISFIIPDCFYFYTETDFVSDNTLHFLSPDKQYRLDLLTTASISGCTENDLALMIKESGEHTILAPTPILVNGLKGHHAIYSGGDELYYELRLQNPLADDEYEQFILLVMCSEDKDILGIAESETIRSIISEIKPEQNPA